MVPANFCTHSLFSKPRSSLSQIECPSMKCFFHVKWYEVGDPEVDLLGEPSGKFDYYVLYPRTKKQISPSSSKEDHNQNQKPPLIPYYQKVLPQTLKCQPLPTKSTQISEFSPCYMFDQASPSYSQNFPPLENFDHPQTNTKHVWKIKNPIGTNAYGTKKQVSSTEAALN